MHSVEFFSTQLAFEGLDIRVDDHVGLERLLLHKAFEAEVTLVSSYVGVDQNVPLHVGKKGELPAADATFVLFHTLVCKGMLLEMVGLNKLHATLRADVRADILVLHHVILELAWVLESFVTFTAVVLSRTTMGRQMPFQLGQCREV